VDTSPHPPSYTETIQSHGQHRTLTLKLLVYNAVLFVVGVATIAGYEWLMTKLIPLGEDAIEPMCLVAGVVVYAAMANLCYTLGWVVELRGRRGDAVAARRRGQWMFRAGLLLSCVLTSLPFWFACLFWSLHRVHAH
jgi:hypothetical protein